ncbi:hypothetical protein AK812_SmicGene12934 [Symbiodinium microadriaticum]|uniref:Uncharacterized protein n=1 Tax=Symbiodinium microadriaticum TaxID=2951 RepID=A0A1Q9E9E0_SYMMI|nr:hypothetical protein AK812_SmicGene12934 [Symbiodinium microadriaticum]
MRNLGVHSIVSDVLRVKKGGEDGYFVRHLAACPASRSFGVADGVGGWADSDRAIFNCDFKATPPIWCPPTANMTPGQRASSMAAVKRSKVDAIRFEGRCSIVDIITTVLVIGWLLIIAVLAVVFPMFMTIVSIVLTQDCLLGAFSDCVSRLPSHLPRQALLKASHQILEEKLEGGSTAVD